MAMYEATVKRAFLSQETLFNNGERCSADGDMLATIGRALGQQIRVKRANGELALYTISETRQEREESIIRMAQMGRVRLATDSSAVPLEFAAAVDAQVPHPTHSDECAQANSEFVERLTDDGIHNGLVAIAPHGGDIEKWTDLQAERVAAHFVMQGVSCWRCKGWRQGGGAYARWHITSPDLHEASFPLLNTIISRGFTYAVAFHGFEEPIILIGGGADALLKCQIKSAIELVLADSGIEVRIATEADKFNGDNPHNIVNRLANGNGLQIEQSLAARQNHWQRIADAVTSVFKCRL